MHDVYMTHVIAYISNFYIYMTNVSYILMPYIYVSHTFARCKIYIYFTNINRQNSFAFLMDSDSNVANI